MVNWTSALCVWDGIVEAESAENKTSKIPVVWKGTWVLNEDAPDASKVKEPPRNAFLRDCDSDKHFSVSGTAQLASGTDASNLFQPFQASFTKGEGYDLNGAKHTDEEHEVLFEKLRWSGGEARKNLVYACGRNEYGNFISVGWMRPGNRLTLARRYLEESDPRAKWGVEMVKDRVLKEIYSEEDDLIVIPPWQCEVFNTEP